MYAPPVVHDVLNSAGQPLDSRTRAAMEPRFGHDFSMVRVHADAKAAESAEAVGALAYTVGRHVVFGAGQSTENTPLFAHELTHVVQQRAADVPFANIEVAPSDDALESDAHANEEAHGPRLQRASFGSSVLGFFSAPLRLFGVENYADDELLDYHDNYLARGAIEDSFDSDNKARAIVKRWRTNRLTFQSKDKPVTITLDKKKKVALAMEMFRGHRSSDDVDQTLALLEGSSEDEVTAIILWVNEEELNTEEKTCRFVSLWNNPNSTMKCPRDRPKTPSSKATPQSAATPYAGKPYPGGATDAISAFFETEQGQRVKTAALERLKRDWDKTTIDEKIAIVIGALAIVGAASYGLATMSRNQQRDVLNLIIEDDDTLLQKPLDTKTTFDLKFEF